MMLTSGLHQRIHTRKHTHHIHTKEFVHHTHDTTRYTSFTLTHTHTHDTLHPPFTPSAHKTRGVIPDEVSCLENCELQSNLILYRGLDSLPFCCSNSNRLMYGSWGQRC